MRATLFVLIFTLILTAYFQSHDVSACNIKLPINNDADSSSTTKATTANGGRILNEENDLLNQIKSKGKKSTKTKKPRSTTEKSSTNM